MRDFVHLVIQEVVVGVEMLIAERALPDDFVGESSLHVHHVFQHLVVGLARKQNLTRVQLK